MVLASAVLVMITTAMPAIRPMQTTASRALAVVLFMDHQELQVTVFPIRVQVVKPASAAGMLMAAIPITSARGAMAAVMPTAA